MKVLDFEGIETVTRTEPSETWDAEVIHRELVEMTKQSYEEMDRAQQKSIEDSFKTFIGS